MTKKEEQEYYYQLGINISKARKLANKTQEELAKQLDLSRTSIVNIEKGHHRVQTHTLVEITEFFGIKLIDLLPSRVSTVNQNKFITLSEIISDKEIIDTETKEAVANFVAFLNK